MSLKCVVNIKKARQQMDKCKFCGAAMGISENGNTHYKCGTTMWENETCTEGFVCIASQLSTAIIKEHQSEARARELWEALDDIMQCGVVCQSDLKALVGKHADHFRKH
jgi:DNA-binding sugar fermentation-stimulating protein